MSHRPVVFPLVLALAACDAHPIPTVAQAWVRLPAVRGQPAAAYATIQAGNRPLQLIKVESALVGRIELHESMRGAGGMTAMKPLTSVSVPAREEMRFAPGGRHLMLFALDPVVVAGTAVPLRFGFKDGTIVEAEAKSVAAGAVAPY